MKTDYSLEMAARPRSKEVGPVSMAVASLRASAGMTQQELAHFLKVAVPTVGRWETGRIPAKNFLKELLAMARDQNRPDLVEIFQAAAQEDIDVYALMALNRIGVMMMEARNRLFKLTSASAEFDTEPLPPAEVNMRADEAWQIIAKAGKLAESFDFNSPKFGSFEELLKDSPRPGQSGFRTLDTVIRT